MGLQTSLTSFKTNTFINPSKPELLMETPKEPKGKFVKVRCLKCKNEQIIFGKSDTKVKCLVCQKTLCEPTGGKSRVKAQILEILK